MNAKDAISACLDRLMAAAGRLEGTEGAPSVNALFMETCVRWLALATVLCDIERAFIDGPHASSLNSIRAAFAKLPPELQDVNRGSVRAFERLDELGRLLQFAAVHSTDPRPDIDSIELTSHLQEHYSSAAVKAGYQKVVPVVAKVGATALGLSLVTATIELAEQVKDLLDASSAIARQRSNDDQAAVNVERRERVTHQRMDAVGVALERRLAEYTRATSPVDAWHHRMAKSLQTLANH